MLYHQMKYYELAMEDFSTVSLCLTFSVDWDWWEQLQSYFFQSKSLIEKGKLQWGYPAFWTGDQDEWRWVSSSNSSLWDCKDKNQIEGLLWSMF
jgi:hypothetical protein